MTVEEYRKRLVEGKAKEKHFIAARNAWRKIVKKRQRQLREALEQRKRNNRPHVVGHNGVEGGEPEERLLYAMEVAHREFRLFYSEAGTLFSHLWALLNVPTNKWRSDCSSWFRAVYLSCGLPDPLKGYSVIYTGSLLEAGREVDRHYAETHAGVAVLFGSGTAFHVAMSTGHGTLVYQHGVPEVDTGTFDQFGSGTEVRYRAFPLTKGSS